MNNDGNALKGCLVALLIEALVAGVIALAVWIIRAT
jgi:hypothetical protein